jgi:hypothetical protein
VAIGSLSFFKRISELFLKVGRSSSITKDLVEVYPTSKDLQHLMCEYLITLVSFCQEIVLVLGKSTILQLGSPFIGFFDKEAAKFEAQLKHWASAIDRQAMVLLSKRQLDAADTVAEISRSLAKWGQSEAKNQRDLVLYSIRLQEKLCSTQSERIAAWRRQRKKGTTQWLFRERAYEDWKESTHSRVLWVQGKLGSGKTVLLANIVAELYNSHTPSIPHTLATEVPGENNSREPIIAYHFCNNDYHGSNSYEKLVGSLFQQILAHLNPDSASVRRMDEYFQNSLSPSLEDEAIAILRNTLPKTRPIFIVIDALDDCQENPVSEALWALKSLSEMCEVHFCCSTRTDAPVSQIIRTVFPDIDHEITMSSAALASEMKNFVEAEFTRRRHIRNMDESLEVIMKDVLVEASEGM